MIRLRSLFSVGATAGLVGATLLTFAHPAAADEYGLKPGCAGGGKLLCAEVQDPVAAFGTNKYVGHDEPSALFYSNVPGSGNNSQYNLTIPTQPKGRSARPTGTTSSCTLRSGSAWRCATPSRTPRRTRRCTPDSDQNIVDPEKNNFAPGVAFEELQFYPPGWIPQFAGSSCDPTRWCVALNIDSLSENPFKGTVLNGAASSTSWAAWSTSTSRS